MATAVQIEVHNSVQKKKGRWQYLLFSFTFLIATRSNTQANKNSHEESSYKYVGGSNHRASTAGGVRKLQSMDPWVEKERKG